MHALSVRSDAQIDYNDNVSEVGYLGVVLVCVEIKTSSLPPNGIIFEVEVSG